MSTEKETAAFILQTLEGQQRDIYNVRSRKPNISNCYDVGFMMLGLRDRTLKVRDPNSN